MKWFRRGTRLNLGRYVGPIDVHHATIDEMVDDGVLIAAAATRLAIKNLVILKALRDRVDYSIDRTTAAVRQELENLAAEKVGDAQRLITERDRAALRSGNSLGHSDYRQADIESLERRVAVSEGLAARLRELSTDDTFVADLVEGSHAAAWREIAASITAKAALATGVVRDARYSRERGERMLGLLGDLNDLDNRER